MSLDVVGTAEVAALFGTSRQTVTRWARSGLLPEPDARIAAGPVWLRSTIMQWAIDTGRHPDSQSDQRKTILR